jgi:hypothetical protein
MFDISSWVGTQHVFLDSKSKREKKVSMNNIDSNIKNEQSLFFFKILKEMKPIKPYSKSSDYVLDEHD